MTSRERRALLRRALRLNGISPDWAKWKDSQGLGQAVREALAGQALDNEKENAMGDETKTVEVGFTDGSVETFAVPVNYELAEDGTVDGGLLRMPGAIVPFERIRYARQTPRA
jgi:hypothetical protein